MTTTRLRAFPATSSAVKCRLLYLVGSLHTGGLERQLCYLLRAMDRERYEPAVTVWNHSEDDVHVAFVRGLGIPLYAFPKGLSKVAKLGALRDLLTKLRPDVIHSYSFYTNFAAHWAALGSPSIPVGSIRSHFLWGVKESGPVLGRLSARWPSTQVCNSISAAEDARSLRSFFVPRQILVVPNGIDLERFSASRVPCSEPVQILGVGYLLPVKRWDWLLLAVQRLKQTGLKCVLRIAGEGPLRAALEHQAASLGIADHVRLIGHTNQVPRLLAEASFLVHTADAEGSPNAVMEAMACGRAVVATDAGDVPFLVDHGRTGFVVGRQDAATFVDRMIDLVLDRDLCQRLGEAGRIKAEREFGLDRLVKETLAAYRAAGWKDGHL